jgi:hypothetical protein
MKITLDIKAMKAKVIFNRVSQKWQVIRGDLVLGTYDGYEPAAIRKEYENASI